LDNNKVEFIMSVKSYNDMDPEEAITVELDVKKDMYSYTSRNYHWKIDDDII